MGFFSKFERHVEDGFEGINDKLFDAPISPVQIAKKAEKQMRREKMVGAGKEYAPTLYTVLVNPDDDARLFGYYPTLAGETETYLRAKAMDQGFVMDGNPLVRFIVDEDLKPGKFDVIAELVSAPIVQQLRNEEMTRYGLGGALNDQQYHAPKSAYSESIQQTPQYQQHQHEAQNLAPQNGPTVGANATPNQPAQPDLYAHPKTQQPVSSGIDVMAEDPAQYDNNFDVYGQPFESVSPNSANAAANAGQTVALTGAPQPKPHQAIQPHLVDLSTGRSFVLTPPRVIIGRGTNCDIVLNDLNVSRTHAEIVLESATTWMVSDLGSTNGTLVNGRHIAQAMLNEGDRITTGTTTFLFTYQ